MSDSCDRSCRFQEKKKEMIWLLILLCGVILFISIEKLSLMPLKVAVAWVLLWGVSGCLATTLFANLSRPEAYALLNVANISTLEFIELMIMLCYIFSGGMIKKALGFYPGLMMIAPVGIISFLSLGLFPGMDFVLAGVITGCFLFLVVIGLILLLRYLGIDSNAFYKTILAAALVNIVIYGLI